MLDHRPWLYASLHPSMRQSAEVGKDWLWGTRAPHNQYRIYHLIYHLLQMMFMCVLWCHAQGHSTCVEALVAWGVNVDYEIPHMGTPLYTACRCREFICARKLLDGGMSQTSRVLNHSYHIQSTKHVIIVQLFTVVVLT